MVICRTSAINIIYNAVPKVCVRLLQLLYAKSTNSDAGDII